MTGAVYVCTHFGEFLKAFDTPEEARAYSKRHERLYRESVAVIRMDDKQFRKYMNEFDSTITDPERVEAACALWGRK